MVRGANEHVFPGENLQGVKYKPVRLSNPHKLVYSPASYGPSYTAAKMPYYGSVDLRSAYDEQTADKWNKKLGIRATRTRLVTHSERPAAGLVRACALARAMRAALSCIICTDTSTLVTRS
jgi:hypothetical protein